MNTLKILYLDNGSLADTFAGHPVGGGTRSNLTLIDALSANEGFDVGVLTVKQIPEHVRNWQCVNLNRRHLFRGPWRRWRVRSSMANWLMHRVPPDSVDVLVTGTDLVGTTVKAARHHGWKNCSIVRAFEYVRPPASAGHWTRADELLKIILHRKRYLKALKTSDLVITNSQFMQSFFQNHFGISSEIVYPPVTMPIKHHEIPRQLRTIGIVNPSEDKGYSVVKAIAKQMPSLCFCYFGQTPSDTDRVRKEIKNLEFHGWRKDVSEIYESVDLMLVPSLWAEPFGRVPVEALTHGIVPLVSNIGGLPEAVNHDERLLIEHPSSVDEWVQRITEFMNNPESMQEIVEKHRQDMEKFSPEVQGRRFGDLLRRVSGKMPPFNA